MASYLLRLVGYGRRREALPKVPTDEVVPMHLFDDYDNVKCNMFWTFRFDDVLDPDMLGNSLSELFQMEGWRKLGGRLRLRPDGRTEIHIPTPFTADRPPIHFTKEHHDIRMSEHPEASKLPRASLRPATFSSARSMSGLAYGPGAPKSLDDLYYSDLPQFSLHVITFADGTLVSITFNHMIADLGGLKTILDAWQLVLAGKQGEVSEFMSFHDDPMAGLYRGQPKEEYLLATRRLTGLNLIRFGLRLAFDSWWRGNLDSRLLCIPKLTTDSFVQKARAQLPVSIGAKDTSVKDVFISEGDIIMAFVNRLMAQSLPTNSSRNLTTLVPVDPRNRVKSVFQEKGAYLGNLPAAVFVFHTRQEAADMPIGELALDFRNGIAAQCTEEQMKAVSSLAYESITKTRNIPVFGPSNTLLLVISSWVKAALLETTDFSPAIIKAGDKQLPGRRISGHPSYIQSHCLEIMSFCSSVTNIVGRDLDGNLWLNADFPSSTWPVLLEYLESFS